MVKYTFLSTTILLGYLFSLNAQENIQNDICNFSWWQQATVEEIRILVVNDNDFDNLRCNEDGDTPLMIAIRAGVSFDVLISVFELIAYNAVTKSLHRTNDLEEDALMLLLENTDDPTSTFDVNVKIDLEGLSKADLPDQ